MAMITGKGGTVDFTVDGGGVNETGIAITSWTLNINRELVNVSAFGDAATQFVSNIAGQMSATATISGMVTTDGAVFNPEEVTAIGAEGSIELSTDGTDKYTFKCFVTGSSHSINRSGDATWTLNVTASESVVAS